MRGFFTCFLLSAVAAFPADPPKGAQPAATPNMASIALMLQLLEGHKPFSAKAEMFLFKGRELVLQSEMPFGFYQGMARMELDVAKIKSAKLTPKGVAGMAVGFGRKDKLTPIKKWKGRWRDLRMVPAEDAVTFRYYCMHQSRGPALRVENDLGRWLHVTYADALFDFDLILILIWIDEGATR